MNKNSMVSLGFGVLSIIIGVIRLVYVNRINPFTDFCLTIAQFLCLWLCWIKMHEVHKS